MTACATVYFELWIKNVKFNNEYFSFLFQVTHENKNETSDCLGHKQSNVSFLFLLKNKDNVPFN